MDGGNDAQRQQYANDLKESIWYSKKTCTFDKTAKKNEEK